IFRQRTPTSVRKRSQEIASQTQLGTSVTTAEDGGDSVELGSCGRLIPEDLKNFWIMLVCTHGWSRKSRGKGIRKSYFEKSTGIQGKRESSSGVERQ
ncbi:hypothetical protein F441_09562, partial [Phytophthora nicotianae CJ01A1]